MQYNVKHVWNENKGWRKNEKLNKSVSATETDYLIFIDGDCIPHPKFIADHLSLRKKGVFLGGRRIELPLSLTNKINSEYIQWGPNFFKSLRKEVIEGSKAEKIKHIKRNYRLPMIKPFIL